MQACRSSESAIAASAEDRLDWIAGLDPGVHAAVHVVRVLVPEIGQRLRRDITPASGLAVDDDVIVQLGADLTVPCSDLAVLDVAIRAGDHAGEVLLGGSDIDQKEALGGLGHGF